MMSESLIFDTSVWIDYLGNCSSEKALLLKSYIKNEKSIFTTPIIIQEILQGVRFDAQYEKLKKSLISYDCLIFNQLDAAIGAAELYRELRKKGVTIRKSSDCLIAWYAIEASLPIVHIDRDFDNISSQTPLKIFKG